MNTLRKRPDNVPKPTRRDIYTRTNINISEEVKKKLALQALNENTNLKNYVEMVCYDLAEYEDYRQFLYRHYEKRFGKRVEKVSKIYL